MTDPLSAFIHHFVEPSKQPRYQTLLSSRKRRTDGIWDLLHDGRHLSKNNFVAVEPVTLEKVQAHLSRLGVCGPVYIISRDEDVDAKILEITAILQEFVGQQTDIVAYDVNANAGYYENHDGEVFVFSKTTT